MKENINIGDNVIVVKEDYKNGIVVKERSDIVYTILCSPERKPSTHEYTGRDLIKTPVGNKNVDKSILTESIIDIIKSKIGNENRDLKIKKYNIKELYLELVRCTRRLKMEFDKYSCNEEKIIKSLDGDDLPVVIVSEILNVSLTILGRLGINNNK